MQRTVGRWNIEHDVVATRSCYEQLPVGTGCGCIHCRNFDAAVGRTFPSEFAGLLKKLGIDSTKPAELCHWYRDQSGLYVTGGWFHFVGSILTGEDAKHWENNACTFRYEEYVPGLEYGFTVDLSLISELFENHPLVQLEFQTRIPWVLAEPEPAN